MVILIDLIEEREKRGKALMKPTTVFDVAQYFLSCVDVDSGSAMTHLKLQKLCYYAQAWNMVFNHEPLFAEKFEAWMHGPACPDLWHAYKEYKMGMIPSVESFDTTIFTPEQLETLEAVWGAYGQFDGKYLEELTHQEDPWINARKGYHSGEKCNEEITVEAMQDYYTRLDEDK